MLLYIVSFYHLFFFGGFDHASGDQTSRQHTFIPPPKKRITLPVKLLRSKDLQRVGSLRSKRYWCRFLMDTPIISWWSIQKKTKKSFNMKMFFYEQCKNGRFLDKKGALKTSMFTVELPWTKEARSWCYHPALWLYGCRNWNLEQVPI